MAQVLTVVIQPLNYDHKFPWHGTAEGGDDFIGQSRVTQLIKQGKKPSAAWGAAQPAQRTCSRLAARAPARVCWGIVARTCSGLHLKSLHLVWSFAGVVAVALQALPVPG